MSRRRSSLGIEYAGGLKEESTAPSLRSRTCFAGVGLLVQLYRQAGVGAAAERALPQKRSPKGLKPGQMVESFVLLSALGGECLEDMERLRQDQGLAALLGYTPPAPETARQWLDRFHDEGLMAQRPAQGSFLLAESAWLAGLRQVDRPVIQGYVVAVQPKREVTLDMWRPIWWRRPRLRPRCAMRGTRRINQWW